MGKRHLLQILTMAVISAFCLQKSGAAENLPNVLLITIDTLRADHLSAYGYQLETSPNIDRLASEGVRFDRAYSVIPLTGPSHFSLFTSRYPQEHGARINGVAVPKNSKWMFLPQALREFGYSNAAFISAWPLTSRLTHLERWFEVYDEELNRSYQLFNSSRYAEDVTPRAISWLTRQKAMPFFLWVHYFDPHAPYLLREQFASLQPSGHKGSGMEWRDAAIRERITKYDSEIAHTDYHLGKLLDALDGRGLRDSTLVILTSDHGEGLGEHGYVGHGQRLYESIVKVPLIMRYPSRIPSGKIVRQKVSLLDVMPTVLDLTLGAIKGVKIPSSFAGRNLTSVLEGKSRPAKRTIRFLTFAGKKGWMPRWLSWVWVGQKEMPRRLGKTEDSLKWVWTPHENLVSVVDTEKDPFELTPQILHDDNGRYEEATAELKHWFETTDLNEAAMRSRQDDEEVLRSLGYTQ